MLQIRRKSAAGLILGGAVFWWTAALHNRNLRQWYRRQSLCLQLRRFAIYGQSNAWQRPQGRGNGVDWRRSSIRHFVYQQRNRRLQPPGPGDHLIEAYALDDLNATARFGTSPVYIRVIPGTSVEEVAESLTSGHSSSNATVSGKTFTQVKDNGVWSDPTTWKDSTGKTGVPGANDLAIVYSFVYLSQSTTVNSVTLAYGLNGGGSIIGGTPGGKNALNTLTVTGNFASYGGADATIPVDFVDLVLPAGSTCNFWKNSALTLPNATIDNYGTLSIHGAQGMTGSANFHNYAETAFQAPLNLPSSAGADPTIGYEAAGVSVGTHNRRLRRLRPAEHNPGRKRIIPHHARRWDRRQQ